MNKTDSGHPEKPGPLDGIKIVEYGLFHAGPGGTAILGDLGAEIIKVEAPSGDPERYWTKVGRIDMSMKNGESLMFEVSNRNKKNICLDIKKPQGREIFNRLIKSADVFMTNLRKSTKIKLKIDYDAISELNPKIIHASVSGYGPDGPMENIGAFDPLGQACSGMMFLTGQPFPAPVQIGVLDQATAITLSHAIITALLARERQGHGQAVQVSLYGTALWLQHPNMMLSNVLSINPCLPPSREIHSPLRNTFCCKDDRWIMGTHHPEERYWKTFCDITGQMQLYDDPGFTDEKGAPKNYTKLIEIFDPIFAEKTVLEWMMLFQEHTLMFCPIQKIEDVENDPQAKINRYVEPFQYRDIGEINIPGYPIHFSANSAGLKSEAPRIGEHTDQIMERAGFSKDEIEKLKEEEVIR